MTNENGFVLKSGSTINVYIMEDLDESVNIACKNLFNDLSKTLGITIRSAASYQKADVIIFENTGNAAEGFGICTDCLMDGATERWEAYMLMVKDRQLYLTGNGRRGVIYAIYELSKRLGVSPWYFWGDIPVKKIEKFELDSDFMFYEWPSIEYRGIFLNDEEELNNWARLHTNDNTIGPETYEKIFELLLRLKANYIWPAMHVNYFNNDPENGRLADRMGIVVGTSHCDMLLRSNQNEWNPWIEKKGYDGLKYDYSIEGENRERLKEYWSESVEMNKDYEVSYTVGMRGIHDTGFLTEAIDELEIPQEEKTDKKVRLLEKVIDDQRQIIASHINGNAEDVFQVFVPYKEVLPLYDAGLKLPDDITLMWVDDNFGYLRRYPSQEEQARKGGNALYYHNSYWAHPKMSYLFINTIPMAQTGSELEKCYEQNIRKIWVLNVGALKPLEPDIEFFVRCGWEAGKAGAITLHPDKFMKTFVEQNFSVDSGEEVSKLYEEFTQRINICKIEHLDNEVFSQEAYGDEAGMRLHIIKGLFDRIKVVEEMLPAEEQDAFFQMFTMKFAAAFYKNAEYYYADRSMNCMRFGKGQAAQSYVDRANEMKWKVRELICYYNKLMSEGKWDGILTPEVFAPPVFSMYPDAWRPVSLDQGKLDYAVWNNENSIEFDRYGIGTKWVELFNAGDGAVKYTAKVTGLDSIITLSSSAGTVCGEERILLTCTGDITESAKGALIIETENDQICRIPIVVNSQKDVCRSKGMHYDADGYVAIPAENYADNDGFYAMNGLGRFHGKLMATGMNRGNAASLRYYFWLEKPGQYEMEICRYLTLKSNGLISFDIVIDGTENMTVTSDTADEWLGSWCESVMRNGEKIMVNLPFLQEGIHELTVKVSQDYLAFNYFIIYTKPKQKNCFIAGLAKEVVNTCNPAIPIWEDRDITCKENTLAKEKYSHDQLRPKLAYADKEYWMSDLVYGVNKCRENPLSPPVNPLLRQQGEGAYVEKNGRIAMEAEQAYLCNKGAYIRENREGKGWRLICSETNGESGYAMAVSRDYTPERDVSARPSLNYIIKIEEAGKYNLWLLMKFNDDKTDRVLIGVDDIVFDPGKQYSGPEPFTYARQQIWFWGIVQTVELSSGYHKLSIIADKPEFRVDRIYMSSGEELPPDDMNFEENLREAY